MATEYIDINVIHIDFNSPNWETAFPDIYTIENTSEKPWFASDTFLYEEHPSFRSGPIAARGSTTFKITFTLVEPGLIRFSYIISSESTYDTITVLSDGTQAIKSSGEIAWTNYEITLTAGTHIIEFTYAKNGSGDRGKDAAALAYIELAGVMQNFLENYLIYDNVQERCFANVDGSLTEVAISAVPPTKEDFIMFGNKLPSSGQLTTLPDYTLWQFSDSIDWYNKIAGMDITARGNPTPTLFLINQGIFLTEQYQTGFRTIRVEFEHSEMTNIFIIISPDKTHWYALQQTEELIDGGFSITSGVEEITEFFQWLEVSYDVTEALLHGMSETTLSKLSPEIFSYLYVEGIPKAMYLAFCIQSTVEDTWALRNMTIEFTSSK